MNEAPYKALWAMVLMMSIRDVRRYLKKHRTMAVPNGIGLIGDAGASLRWINNRSNRPGSFRWCCSVLDYDPEWVIDNIRKPRMKTLARFDKFLEGYDDS